MAAPISAEEVAHRAASDAELIAWVDEQDRPLGSLPRAELRERGLIGRGTFILLFNSAGELCVQRRTLSKAGKRPVVKKASSLSALGGLVYSTDGGRHCPDCQQPKDACICGQAVAPVGDGIARVRRETKGRGGKTVTTISGLPLAGDALKELASALKRRCGTGGSLKDGVVEIQGEHVELLIDELLKRGFKAKKSGG